MTTQPPDLKKLREVAERATGGNWRYREINPKDKKWGACEITSKQDFIATMVCGVNNAKFMAEANPQTILALLDELAALRKENEGLRALAEKVIDDYSYYERYGATCTFEGAPMIYASVLEELMEAARAAIGDSHE